jgi:heptosyltransferase-2
VSRLLVVQTAQLGDIVLTTPLVAELKRARPAAHLTLVTTPAGRELLAPDPRVDAILVLDKSPTPRGKWSYARLLANLLRGGYDLAIAAHRSVRSGVLVRVSRAPDRLGFAGAPGAWAYTRTAAWAAEHHAVWRYLALAEAAGGRADGADPRPRLVVDPGARDRVQRLLEGRDPIVCLAPGSARATKRWTSEGFAAVARAVRERGLHPVIVGAPSERPLCEQVAGLAGGALVLAGRIGVSELVAIVSGARAVVANDSGPGHVAAAVGTPVVSIFGPTSPAFYAPFGDSVRVVAHEGLACRPCGSHAPRACPLRHFRCMRELAAERVVAALEPLLAERRA